MCVCVCVCVCVKTINCLKIVKGLYKYDYENEIKIDEQNCNEIEWNLFAEIRN